MLFCRRKKLSDRQLNPDQRFGIVTDSAFPCGGDMRGRILTPLKEGDLGRLVSSVRRVAGALSSAITSIGQSAQWVMGSIEKVYHCLFAATALR
ncbi:hypothetical protein F442_11370 [Phytophthora nicotianae P10297]|uniref:DDE Tnp4 domain-containing protein n=1 Tax=Phytophthora nicotianae P10297 TaxID=1317064 RepID=W2Z5P1_PHYNI|nr:hypothetical protein F442_11370 [Phytophthora nicotianae P10297]